MKSEYLKEYYNRNKKVLAEKAKIYREKNKEKINKQRREYRTKNREKLLDINRQNYEKRRKPRVKKVKVCRVVDKDKAKQSVTRWRKSNKGKANFYAAKRRASKLQATPIWLSPGHCCEIKTMYIMAETMTQEQGVKYHVDHIVPLQGKTVCGLHVPWNLQIIRAADNISKGNRLINYEEF